MRLRRGKSRYKLPPYSNIFGVCVEGNQRHNQMVSYAIHIVRLEDLGALKQVPAMPTRCAIFNDIIEFAPPPDKPYVVKVTYAPPIQEV